MIRKEEHPAPTLGHTVIRGIYDSPFDYVSKIGERSEHDGEISSALLYRGLEEPVDIF